MSRRLAWMAVGTVAAERKRIGVTPEGAKFAVIGRPLVGPAVLAHPQWVAPLSLFVELLASPSVYELVRSVPKAFTTNGCNCRPPTAAKGGPAPARCRSLPLVVRRRRF